MSSAAFGRTMTMSHRTARSTTTAEPGFGSPGDVSAALGVMSVAEHGVVQQGTLQLCFSKTQKPPSQYDAWSKHWCVLSGRCLYLYTTPQQRVHAGLLALSADTQLTMSAQRHGQAADVNSFHLKYVEGLVGQAHYKSVLLCADSKGETQKWAVALARQQREPFAPAPSLQLRQAALRGTTNERLRGTLSMRREVLDTGVRSEEVGVDLEDLPLKLGLPKDALDWAAYTTASLALWNRLLKAESPFGEELEEGLTVWIHTKRTLRRVAVLPWDAKPSASAVLAANTRAAKGHDKGVHPADRETARKEERRDAGYGVVRGTAERKPRIELFEDRTYLLLHAAPMGHSYGGAWLEPKPKPRPSPLVGHGRPPKAAHPQSSSPPKQRTPQSSSPPKQSTPQSAAPSRSLRSRLEPHPSPTSTPLRAPLPARAGTKATSYGSSCTTGAARSRRPMRRVPSPSAPSTCSSCSRARRAFIARSSMRSPTSFVRTLPTTPPASCERRSPAQPPQPPMAFHSRRWPSTASDGLPQPHSPHAHAPLLSPAGMPGSRKARTALARSSRAISPTAGTSAAASGRACPSHPPPCCTTSPPPARLPRASMPRVPPSPAGCSTRRAAPLCWTSSSPTTTAPPSAKAGQTANGAAPRRAASGWAAAAAASAASTAAPSWRAPAAQRTARPSSRWPSAGRGASPCAIAATARSRARACA